MQIQAGNEPQNQGTNSQTIQFKNYYSVLLTYLAFQYDSSTQKY